MKKIGIFTAITAALALNATAGTTDMEKCKIVKDGKGLIKAHQADCAATGRSCAGQNKAGDPDAWIMVPKGQCQKINAGDFSELPQKIKNKIKGAH